MAYEGRKGLLSHVALFMGKIISDYVSNTHPVSLSSLPCLDTPKRQAHGSDKTCNEN